MLDLVQRPAITVVLTHYVEKKRLALPVALRVVPDAGVIPGRRPADSLEHQALVADDNALSGVVIQYPALSNYKAIH